MCGFYRVLKYKEMAGPARWRPAIFLENSLPMIPWDEREIHELKIEWKPVQPQFFAHYLSLTCKF